MGRQEGDGVISRETTVLGPVDCTAAQLERAVAAYAPGQPAYGPIGVGVWADMVIKYAGAFGLRPSVIGGQTLVETNGLRFGGDVSPGQYNLAGIGTTGGGVPGERWSNIPEGVIGQCVHWLGYVYGAVENWPVALRRYAPAARRQANIMASGYAGMVATIGDLGGGVWAVDPDYADSIVRAANLIQAQPGGQPMAPLIALSSGHHNRQSGDAEEIKETGQLTPAIAAACRAAGLDVVVLTPDDGRGTSPDSLDTIAARTPANAAIYMETHTEAGPRGVFVIYPDWGDDVDTDVRDRLGPAIAQAVSKATGLPIRGNGTMSERETGVGAGGDRLGVFRATAGLRASTTRMIIEFGSHTQSADLAIINAPGFYQKAAGAVAGAFADYLGVTVPVQTAAQPPASEGYTPPASIDTANVSARINEQGETILTINFGGKATAIEGYIVADAGVTIVNDGVEYSRSIKTEFQPWVKH